MISPDSKGVSSFFHRLWSSKSVPLMVAASVFLLVAAVGATMSSFKETREANHVARAGPRSETLARLEDYTRSIAADAPASTAAAGTQLPDVHVMIERLAARLEATPEDAKGWRMLGWSYFHTERYSQAAQAYARAVELDPSSAELKAEYEEVKAKAAGGDTPAAAASQLSQTGPKASERPSAEQRSSVAAMQPHDSDAAIRSMVDGLAARLEHSPGDVDGWARLMRSRVVLGETEVAAKTFRKALDVFKGDGAASARILAAATELGLKAE